MLPTTSGLETEWDYSGRKGRNGQKKKIGKANERKEKIERGKDEEVNGQFLYNRKTYLCATAVRM